MFAKLTPISVIWPGEWETKAYAERVIGSIRRKSRLASPYCPHYQEQH